MNFRLFMGHVYPYEYCDEASTYETADINGEDCGRGRHVESANDIKMLRKMLSIPDREKYLKKIEKDPILAVLHLAVFLWNTQTALAAAPYIDRLPSDYLDQFYYLMATTRQYKTQL